MKSLTRTLRTAKLLFASEKLPPQKPGVTRDAALLADADYLARYPDVAQAVADKAFSSGWDHFRKFGQEEKRSYIQAIAPVDHKPQRQLSGQMTRGCRDPWSYLEITPDLGLMPCCKKPAIAKWSGEGGSLEDLRNSAPFEKLRGDLLAGRLDGDCQGCHIRPMVPVEELRESLPQPKPESPDPTAAMLKALPLDYLRLEVTTRCNLRCVYCAVSQSSYKGIDMPASFFDDVITLVRAQPKEVAVFVNGHGETTYHPDWLKICKPLTDAGVRPEITTNLAKPLNEQEVDCLAHFDVVQISLDSVNAEQLRELRRHVKLANVIENIRKIRAAAVTKGITSPRFTISCGVYDANYTTLEDVAAFCIAHDIFDVTFWQLSKYDDLPGVKNVYPIPSLSPERITAAIGHMERTLKLLSDAGIWTTVAGDFVKEWKDLVAAPDTPSETVNAA